MAARLNLAEFIARWQPVRLSERATAQSHFIDLCDVLGQPHPVAADPAGAYYTFEKGVTKTGGGQGFADVWLRTRFAWEYKKQHKNLGAAYQQLLQYREDLENPPLLVVCDLNRFEVHTNFTGTAKRVYAFELADLATPAATTTSARPPLEVLRALFTDPERLRPQQTTAQVTEQAAREFATLAESLRRRGHDPEQAAHFLMRLLFCLFAEDIGLLENTPFTQLLKNWQSLPSDFTRLLRTLFAAMATGGAFGPYAVPYFNGGLFADDTALELTADDLKILARAAALDWSSVEPAIFGTLFERSLDPGKRAQLGAHYTSRDDIELIVEPVLMAPLRRRWADVQAQAVDLAAKRDAATGTQRTRHEQALQRVLYDFAAEIARVRVLDPACGSGNFLYVALKHLLDLEKEVISFAVSQRLTAFIPQVDPGQLYGIELNAYAHELAQVVVWIGYIQWLHDNGFGIPSHPILKPLQNIRRMDALLARDDHDHLIEPPWPQANVIIGNPPFLGGKFLRRELGAAYVNELFELYGHSVPREADLVCYWFERARDHIDRDCAGRAGLLATQGIRGGANRRLLQRIKETGDIFMAWSDQPWVLEGATVHVSIIGFDDGTESSRSLDGRLVPTIHADLSGALDLTRIRRLRENLGISFMGITKVGPFDIPGELARWMLDQPNIHGRSNRDVLRPWVHGRDLNSRSRDSWIIDFPPGTTIEQAALYEAPFAYVEKHVKPVRARNARKAYAQRWWIHAEARPAMRAALRPLRRYIATSMVSKHRIFVWLPTDALAENVVIVMAREDDYFLGVLQSAMHEEWARRTGTQLREAESGSRYTPTTTFETFPFPWPPGKEPAGDPRVEAVAQAARELVEKRGAWLNPPGATEAQLKERTLTNLYNQRPAWLDMAHRKLDAAVCDAYGWAHDLGDEQILDRLLALNLQRASA